MITRADVERLLKLRAEKPAVLSLYVSVPLDPAQSRGVFIAADGLVSTAAAGLLTASALEGYRRVVRRMLDEHARVWRGHTVAMFSCGELDLAEAMQLPCELPDRAVFGRRAHVRPLIAALQRCPPYHVVIVDRSHGWVFRVSGEHVDTVGRSRTASVRGTRFGGWYGLDSHRINERVAQLARHQYHVTAAILGSATRAGESRPLVVGGHKDSVARFLSILPAHIGAAFIGSFVVDPHTMTSATIRRLAEPLVGTWQHAREEELVSQLLQEEPRGLSVTGMERCLAAVNRRLVQMLVVPVDGLAPGLACSHCGELGGAPGWVHEGTEAQPVPDLIEEMVTRTLDDREEIATVSHPPEGVAARLRTPLPAATDGQGGFS
jgi:hypothetical protein